MRYIDADAAVEEARLAYCKDCNSYNGIKCRACPFDDAMSFIEDYPAADVVPKSEVEKLQEAYNNRLAKDIQTNADFVRYAQAEVAREIFEAIENEINNDLKNNKKVLPQIEISNVLWNRVSGRINAFQGVLEYIAELKKQYKEDQQ